MASDMNRRSSVSSDCRRTQSESWEGLSVGVAVLFEDRV